MGGGGLQQRSLVSLTGCGMCSIFWGTRFACLLAAYRLLTGGNLAISRQGCAVKACKLNAERPVKPGNRCEHRCQLQAYYVILKVCLLISQVTYQLHCIPADMFIQKLQGLARHTCQPYVRSKEGDAAHEGLHFGPRVLAAQSHPSNQKTFLL